MEKRIKIKESEEAKHQSSEDDAENGYDEEPLDEYEDSEKLAQLPSTSDPKLW
jgi:hypothetical protein